MDEQQAASPNPFDQQFTSSRPSVQAHLNGDLPLIKSDYMPGETDRTEGTNRALNGSVTKAGTIEK